jgi:hypothetical protein
MLLPYICNAVAGLAAAAKSKYRYDSSLDWVSGPSDSADVLAEAARSYQNNRFFHHILSTGGYLRRW